MHFQLIDAVERLSQALLPFLAREILYTAIVFVVIWGISLIFKKYSPRWHLGLWALVLLRLVLPPDWTHSLSGRNLIGQSEWAGQAWHEVVAWLFPLEKPANTYVLVSPQSIVDEGLPIEMTPVVFEEEPQQKISVQSIVLLGWLAGALFFLGFYVKRLSRYYRILRRAAVVEQPKIRELTFTWRKKMQINRIVRVVSSDNALSPFTLGIFRPVIFLPNTIIGQNDPDLLESIIAHEIAHIRRLDDLWLKLQNLLQVIYFFHPAVWFANSKICLARECLCDSLVLAQNKISPNAYGKSILTILKLNLFGSAALGLLPGFGSHRQKFRYRILKLKGGHTMKKTQAIFLNMILLALALFILPMAGQVMVESAAKPDSEVVEETGGTEEVVNPDFALPVREGIVTYSFGSHDVPNHPDRIERHGGVDIVARKGAPLFAAADGIVFFANWASGYGNLIILEHPDKIFTYYGHLDKINVNEKQEVKKGELIGEVGSTGRATVDHLHFEIRDGDKQVNPENYISFEKLKASKGKEKFILPINEGVVSDRFGMRLDKFIDKVKHHNGIDIRAPKGTPVFACKDGIVKTAQSDYTVNKGYGRKIRLEHENSFESLYAHLDKVNVQEGRQVKAGEAIGTVGNTGRATAHHLHFEIRKDRKAVNPEIYLDFSKIEPVQFKEKADINFNLQNPLQAAKVSAPFGEQLDPINKKPRFHRGIDFPAKTGTQIFAVDDGKIVLAESDVEIGKGYGKNIILQHSAELRTRYGQMDSLYVTEGQAVAKGQAIGEVGSSGRSTGPHLHFELIFNGKPINPANHLDLKQMRKNLEEAEHEK